MHDTEQEPSQNKADRHLRTEAEPSVVGLGSQPWRGFADC